MEHWWQPQAKTGVGMSGFEFWPLRCFTALFSPHLEPSRALLYVQECAERSHSVSFDGYGRQQAKAQAQRNQVLCALEESLHLCRPVSHPLLQTRVSSPSVPWRHIPLLKPDTSTLRQSGNNSSWAHMYTEGWEQCVSQSWHDTGFAYQPISLMFFLKSKQKVKICQRAPDNSTSPDIIDLPKILRKICGNWGMELLLGGRG